MKKVDHTEEEWRQCLNPDQFRILRDEGTERPFTSPLHAQKGKGIYKCAGCGTPLFTSEMKYDGGTGWPSFFETLPGIFETRTDKKLFRVKAAVRFLPEEFQGISRIEAERPTLRLGQKTI